MRSSMRDRASAAASARLLGRRTPLPKTIQLDRLARVAGGFERVEAHAAAPASSRAGATVTVSPAWWAIASMSAELN